MLIQVPDPLFDLGDLRVLINKWNIDCGRRVLTERIKLDIKRPDFAAMTGTTEPTIQRVEQGVLNPRDHLKLAIAAALGLEVEMLWPFPKIAEALATREAA